MEGLAGRLLGVVFVCRGELGAGVFNEVTYQDDIVLQLRRAAVWSMLNGQRQMLETAADEIERLRLTDAERAAVLWAVSAARNAQHPADDTLHGLLERTK